MYFTTEQYTEMYHRRQPLESPRLKYCLLICGIYVDLSRLAVFQ